MPDNISSQFVTFLWCRHICHSFIISIIHSRITESPLPPSPLAALPIHCLPHRFKRQLVSVYPVCAVTSPSAGITRPPYIGSFDCLSLRVHCDSDMTIDLRLMEVMVEREREDEEGTLPPLSWVATMPDWAVQGKRDSVGTRFLWDGQESRQRTQYHLVCGAKTAAHKSTGKAPQSPSHTLAPLRSGYRVPRTM